jgi:DNA-binding NarL/FixJ family response regulator
MPAGAPPANRQIATQMVISLRTAETHVQHIMAKLGEYSVLHTGTVRLGPFASIACLRDAEA